MKIKNSEISIQEAKFYATMSASSGWKTSTDIAATAKINPRSGRLYALKFVRLGIADVTPVFPAYRYMLSDKAGKRNASYVQRLNQAVQIFGIAAKAAA